MVQLPDLVMGELKKLRRIYYGKMYERKISEIVDRFHLLYYDAAEFHGTWNNTFWLGVPVLKCPFDLWIYQETLFELRPDIIIECGTSSGGSALFLASICDIIGSGEIVTIDIQPNPDRPKHKRITYLLGSSTSAEIVEKVKNLLQGKQKVLLILDSDHSKSHVLDEMTLYSKFVSRGSYMIVEDTNLNGHPVYPGFGPGPMEAVQEFLAEHSEFIIDESREKFYLTFYPNGWLKKT